MKKVHFVLLFVFCIALVLLVDAQDITSFVDLFTLHPVDYIFLVIWALVFYVLLLPFAMLSHKLLSVPEKK